MVQFYTSFIAFPPVIIHSFIPHFLLSVVYLYVYIYGRLDHALELHFFQVYLEYITLVSLGDVYK